MKSQYIFKGFKERRPAGQILTLLLAEENVEYLLGLQPSPTGFIDTELWFILCPDSHLPAYAVFIWGAQIAFLLALSH